MHDGKSHHAAGAWGGWRGKRGQDRELAARRSVHGWPVGARGAGGWCGAAFCVHRWYGVGDRCGRERARRNARACCTGWRRAADAMRVGGPHGRGMLLRPCAPCNPARLMTQILGVVQPGSRGCVPCAGLPPSLIVGAGGQRGPYSVRCHYQTIFHETATAIPARTARSVTFRSCSGVPVRGADGILQELTPLGLVGVSSWRPWWVGTPLFEPAHDRTVGRVHCPKWSLDLFLLQGLPLETRWLPGQRPVGGARPELVRYHLFFGLWDVRLS